MGDSKNRRDSKDPMPNARHSHWAGGGNEPYPAGEEEHGQAKAERISPASRFDKNKPGPEQPTRNQGGKTTQHGIKQSGGNVAATQATEDHGQRKAERIPASSRF